MDSWAVQHGLHPVGHGPGQGSFPPHCWPGSRWGSHRLSVPCRESPRRAFAESGLPPRHLHRYPKRLSLCQNPAAFSPHCPSWDRLPQGDLPRMYPPGSGTFLNRHSIAPQALAGIASITVKKKRRRPAGLRTGVWDFPSASFRRKNCGRPKEALPLRPFVERTVGVDNVW